jgi:hypothetical protein
MRWPVGHEKKTTGEEDYGPFAGYEPTRTPKLRHAANEPPPLPSGPADDDDGFGHADEDGLRMLAALETLTSLEPDYYSDDLAAEASVTIIESASYEVVAEALAADGRSLRVRPRDFDDAHDVPLNDYDDFGGLGDEASVEIVEVVHSFDAPEPAGVTPPTHPTSLARRIAAATGRGAAGSRFFKALSGGS